ncbi:hypothetical protein CEXT_533501 [Caerostris extrusa]|uniref:Uncharacterized protein n=1 Tax=Caerostris extrusa TaxID=172846 RepID=A0AAV4XRT5_CAEEX|nr:hypothetical protein CEXT_533501 [Caerostris extrusa]
MYLFIIADYFNVLKSQEYLVSFFQSYKNHESHARSQVIHVGFSYFLFSFRLTFTFSEELSGTERRAKFAYTLHCPRNPGHEEVEIGGPPARVPLIKRKDT